MKNPFLDKVYSRMNTESMPKMISGDTGLFKPASPSTKFTVKATKVSAMLVIKRIFNMSSRLILSSFCEMGSTRFVKNCLMRGYTTVL